MFKNKKGITLIALIVTIIVMLILAAVSIGIVVGRNGIILRAKEAGVKTELASFDESIKLGFADLIAEYYSKYFEESLGDADKVYTPEHIKEAIERNFEDYYAEISITFSEDAPRITIESDKYVEIVTFKADAGNPKLIDIPFIIIETHGMEKYEQKEFDPKDYINTNQTK